MDTEFPNDLPIFSPLTVTRPLAASTSRTRVLRHVTAPARSRGAHARPT